MSRNVTQEGGLTGSDELLIVALLRKPTVKEAAKECGVSERTVFRRLQDGAFRERYGAARREATNDAIRELQGKSLLAVETLARNLTCGNAFAENAAANAILTHSLKAVELEDLIERIKRVEKTLEGARGARR